MKLLLTLVLIIIFSIGCVSSQSYEYEEYEEVNLRSLSTLSTYNWITFTIQYCFVQLITRPNTAFFNCEEVIELWRSTKDVEVDQVVMIPLEFLVEAMPAVVGITTLFA